MSSAAHEAPAPARAGSFKYLVPSVEHSLYRNGKVLTRRDRDGSDAVWEGVDLEDRTMQVADARALTSRDQPTLAANGFEMRPSTIEGSVDFFDHESVVRQYYPQCVDLVRTASGARTVAAFDHNVRSASGKSSKRRIEGGQQVQGPAHVVHGDYTLTSAPQRLRDLTKPPATNDTYRTTLGEGESLLDAGEVAQALDHGHFAIINVWRNIADTPVVTHPLALCDATSVEPEDLVVFEIHYADRIGENYFAKQADRHRWYLYPELTRDEGLLIKQWDSDGQLAKSGGAQADTLEGGQPCTFSFHSAFADPMTPPDAPDRWSIEVRCVALYD